MTGRVILLRQTAGAAVPLELQNQSTVVHGNIRILSGQCVPGGPVGARCLHRCHVNEAIDLQTGIREGTSPFWKTAVGTRENCEGTFSISPGANTMQHS